MEQFISAIDVQKSDAHNSRFIVSDSMLPEHRQCPRCLTKVTKNSNFTILGKVQDGIVKYYDEEKKLVPLKDADKGIIDKHRLKMLNAKRQKAYF
jgi:hypothetical protein